MQSEVSRDQVRSSAPNFGSVSFSLRALGGAPESKGVVSMSHSPTQSTSTASGGQHNEFVHKIAIKLSRAINSINPNDLFARRVIDIAKSNANDLQLFINGENFDTVACFAVMLILGSPSWEAARGFGNFKDQFLQELHSEIMSHDKQEKAGHIVVAPEGMTVEDNDILEPEPIRKGGLQRSGAVCSLFLRGV